MKQLWKESRGNFIGGLAVAAVLALLSWLVTLYANVGLKPFVAGGFVLLWVVYLGYVVYWVSRRGRREPSAGDDDGHPTEPGIDQPPGVSQTATGSYIAQASHGGTASVNVTRPEDKE